MQHSTHGARILFVAIIATIGTVAQASSVDETWSDEAPVLQRLASVGSKTDDIGEDRLGPLLEFIAWEPWMGRQSPAPSVPSVEPVLLPEYVTVPEMVPAPSLYDPNVGFVLPAPFEPGTPLPATVAAPVLFDEPVVPGGEGQFVALLDVGGDYPAETPSPAQERAQTQAPAPVSAPVSQPRIPYEKLKAAAERACGGIARACYDTAVNTVHNAGGRGNGDTWATSKKYQGRPMGQGLKDAIAAGHLRPGAVIYVSRRPGTDPRSLNMANLPHWMTYLGKDSNGIHRFGDNYHPRVVTVNGVNQRTAPWSLDEAADYYGGTRRIDEILDPWAGR